MPDQRKIFALDTETTGLDPAQGDRVIELGIVEVDDFKLTGREFHVFLNPEGRVIHKEAEAIHGISNGFLEDKPAFKTIAKDFLEFVSDGYVLIHNAAFDVGFLDAELTRAGFAPLQKDRVIDNIDIAKRRYPGSPTNLDALCRRLKVDNSSRDKHGALLDAQLLARVYIAMEGIVQRTLDFGASRETPSFQEGILDTRKRSILRVTPTQDELMAHRSWIAENVKDSLWSK